jgi:hypothetical protein
MLKDKAVLISVVAAILLILSSSQGQALTPASEKSTTPQGTSQVKILNRTGFIVKIQKNTLYLENNERYSLSNVKVKELSGGNHVSDKKKTADMLFVNGVLKEVTIR